MNERSGRALMLASGAMAAFGAGLLAYRWFVLGFSWESGRSNVMTALAIGALIGGSQGVRAMTARKITTAWWMRAAAALPGLAAGAAIGFAIAPTLGHVALRDRDLGGFTIALPGGDEKVEGQSYATGSVRVDLVGGFDAAAMVKWEPGALFDAQQLGMLVAAISDDANRAAPATTRFDVPGGLASQSLELHGKVDLWVTVIACGGGRVELFTRGGGARDLHARILDSVRCHPDAKRAQGASGVPVIVDLAPGWSGQTLAPGQVGFGTATSDEGAVVQVQAGTYDEGELQQLLPKLMTARGGQLTLVDSVVASGPAGTRTLHHVTLALDGQQMAGMMAAWGCPDRGMFLIAIYLHRPGGDDANARDFLLRARCARPDEQVPAYPAAK